MKRLISLGLTCIVLLLILCACDSKEVKQAKEAYEEGNYSEVVELLSQEEELDDATKDILTISEANIMFEKKEFLEAVKKLASSSEGVKNEQFSEMFDAALEDAIANKNVDAIIELLSIDETKEDIVYEKITTVCSDKNYNGFIVLDGMIKNLEDGDLKSKLDAFSEEHDILRAESYLVGNWTRKPDGDKTASIIEVVPYDDNFVGKFKQVCESSREWHFKEGEVVWEEFQFENSTDFLYTSMVKYSDGSSYKEANTGKIDYDKGTLTLLVADDTRVWKRIDK